MIENDVKPFSRRKKKLPSEFVILFRFSMIPGKLSLPPCMSSICLPHVRVNRENNVGKQVEENERKSWEGCRQIFLINMSCRQLSRWEKLTMNFQVILKVRTSNEERSMLRCAEQPLPVPLAASRRSGFESENPKRSFRVEK